MAVFQLKLQFDDKGALVGAKRLNDLAKSAEDAQKSISSTNNALAKLKGLGAGLADRFATSKTKKFTEEAFNLASAYEAFGVVVQQVGQVNGYSAVAEAGEKDGKSGPEIEKLQEPYSAAFETNTLKEFSDLSANYSNNQEYQNKPIDEQAKLYSSELAPEPQNLVDESERLRKLEEARDPLSGSIRGLLKYADEATDMAKGFESAWNSWIKTMEDALTNFVITGKLSFSDLANSIIADLARIAIRQSITGPLASGLSSAFWKFFGSSSSWQSGGFSASTANEFAALESFGFHRGGMVGYSAPTFTRPIPEAIFHGAPRLHGGGGIFGHDEYPAVLLRGERVLNRDETRAYSAGMALSGFANQKAPQVNIYNSTGEPVTQQTRTDNYGNQSVDVMVGNMAASQMARSGTALNRAIKTVGGLKTQAIKR